MTEQTPWSGPIVVTGTDTGVGKTIVTAAIAAAAGAAGRKVAVIKPAQSGTGGGDDDIAAVAQLANPALGRALASYPDPLAPYTAALVSGAAPPDRDETLAEIDRAVDEYDVVLIEGAGGLLVQLGTEDGRAWNVADLAHALGAPSVVVTRAALGTLNHTALTLEALRSRGLTAATVIGAWPKDPELVHRTNLTELPGELLGVLPENVSDAPPAWFRANVAGWLSPRLYGTLDPAAFREQYGYRL
jgi:dethiobiotin synthetase